MQLLEIKNNLAKLSYSDSESPVLGRFIVLTSEEKSYVAQFVNLKSDSANCFAIAKLLFTFTSEGIVDNYDGSIPNMNSEISFLPADELLGLLPVETPIKIGKLAQQDDMLELDVSVFERNLVAFVQKDANKTTLVSNCVRQLFQMKEKSVIIDPCNLFEDYKKIVFTKDFKLPLNSRMIDYIFEYELAEVDAPTKAVIQDIFYAVQQYIQTLDFEFLPIDNFVDVVATQYKETQMPELALLKNKLLKYRDANVFANTQEEVLALKQKLDEKNCSIIDIKDIHDSLQKEVLAFVHSTLETYDKYVYFFVPLNDENSDKRLLRQFINHNRVFTTIMVESSYKYANELKQHAQNMILFAPQDLNHDFSAYNTFLNKLNSDECIVYGKLTQGIPFIVDMTDLDLDLTMEDVAGDKYQFVPVNENVQLVKVDELGDKTLLESEPFMQEPIELVESDMNSSMPVDEIQNSSVEVIEEPIPVQEEIGQVNIDAEESQIEENTLIPEPNLSFSPEHIDLDEFSEIMPAEDVAISEPDVVEPVANILEDDSIITEEPLELDSVHDSSQDDSNDEIIELETLTEDDLNFMEENQFAQPEELSEGDGITDSYQADYSNEQTPVVPVYPVEGPESDIKAGVEFQRGDTVTHIRYGRGVIEKIIKYGNKNLCAITFENVGRRLLDPSISELTKI